MGASASLPWRRFRNDGGGIGRGIPLGRPPGLVRATAPARPSRGPSSFAARVAGSRFGRRSQPARAISTARLAVPPAPMFAGRGPLRLRGRGTQQAARAARRDLLRRAEAPVRGGVRRHPGSSPHGLAGRGDRLPRGSGHASQESRRNRGRVRCQCRHPGRRPCGTRSREAPEPPAPPAAPGARPRAPPTKRAPSQSSSLRPAAMLPPSAPQRPAARLRSPATGSAQSLGFPCRGLPVPTPAGIRGGPNGRCTCG